MLSPHGLSQGLTDHGVIRRGLLKFHPRDSGRSFQKGARPDVYKRQHTQTIAKRLSDVNGLPEKEAKKLLGVMDEDDDDNWD